MATVPLSTEKLCLSPFHLNRAAGHVFHSDSKLAWAMPIVWLSDKRFCGKEAVVVVASVLDVQTRQCTVKQLKPVPALHPLPVTTLSVNMTTAVVVRTHCTQP